MLLDVSHAHRSARLRLGSVTTVMTIEGKCVTAAVTLGLLSASAARLEHRSAALRFERVTATMLAAPNGRASTIAATVSAARAAHRGRFANALTAAMAATVSATGLGYSRRCDRERGNARGEEQLFH
ncbi:MAG: hypothetical protein ABIQ32_05900 [Sphingomicrobium sp.]